MAPARFATARTSCLATPPKKADPHYGTPEHKAWSAAVIARANGTCQGDDCARSGVRMFADHIVEKRDGGALLDLKNGRALCGSCHTRKTLSARASRWSA